MTRRKAATIFWAILALGPQVFLVKSNLAVRSGAEPAGLGWLIAMMLVSIPAMVVLTRTGQQAAHRVRAEHEAARARATSPESAPMVPSPRRLAFLVAVELVLPMLIIATSLKLLHSVATATGVDQTATKVLMLAAAIAWGVFAYFHLKTKATELEQAKDGA